MQLSVPPPLPQQQQQQQLVSYTGSSPAPAQHQVGFLRTPEYLLRHTVSRNELVATADQHFAHTFYKALWPEKRVSPPRFRGQDENADRYHHLLESLDASVMTRRLPVEFTQGAMMFSQLFSGIVEREVAEWALLMQQLDRLAEYCWLQHVQSTLVEHEAWARRCMEHALAQNTEILEWFAECFFAMLKLWIHSDAAMQRFLLFTQLQLQFSNACLVLENDFVSCSPLTGECEHLLWTRRVRHHSSLLRLTTIRSSCYFSNCILSERWGVLDAPMLAEHRGFVARAHEQLDVLRDVDATAQAVQAEEANVSSRMCAYGAYLNRRCGSSSSSQHGDAKDGSIVLSHATFLKVAFHNKRETIERDWLVRTLVWPFQFDALGELEQLTRAALHAAWFTFARDVALAASETAHRGVVASGYLWPLLPRFAELEQRRGIEQQWSSTWSELYVHCHSLACLQRLEVLRRRELVLLSMRTWQSIVELHRALHRLLSGAAKPQASTWQRDLLSADMQGRMDYFMIAESKARTSIASLEGSDRLAVDMVAGQLLHRAMIGGHALYLAEASMRELLIHVAAPEALARQGLERQEARGRERIAATLRPIACFAQLPLAAAKQQQQLTPRPPPPRAGSVTSTAAPTLTGIHAKRAPISSVVPLQVKVGDDSILSLVSALASYLPSDLAFAIVSDV